MQSAVPSKQTAIAHEIPSWEGIAYALKSLFGELDIDLSRVGVKPIQSRLIYEDFEAILYNLLIFIEPTETKRRFRPFRPARNAEERKRFIDTAVTLINGKQIYPHRVASSQLLSLGGESFRRLMGALIKVACEREIERTDPANQFPVEDQISLHSNRMETLLNYWHEMSNSVSSTLSDLNRSMECLRDIRKNLEESQNAIQSKWWFMADKLARDDTTGSLQTSVSNNSLNQLTNQIDVAPVVGKLLSQLGESHGRSKKAVEKIQAIEVPREGLLDPGKSAVRKRLSQFIREEANKFSQELLPDDRQTTLQVRQKLLDYDQGVQALIEKWLHEEIQMQDELLQMPDINQMYAKLEELIPRIELRPIKALDDATVNGCKAKHKDIEKILSEYPDGRYDEHIIDEVTRKHFN